MIRLAGPRGRVRALICPPRDPLACRLCWCRPRAHAGPPLLRDGL